MSTDVLAAIRDLQISETQNERNIDEYLFEHRPRKRTRLSDEELKSQLEEEFLKPSYTFSIEWLNKLQT